MAGHSQHPTVFPFVAGEDLSGSQYHFVKMDPAALLTTNEIIACDTAAEAAVGILVNEPTEGEPAQVARIGSRTKLYMDDLDETMEPGNLLTTDADGHGVLINGPAGLEYVNAMLVAAPEDTTPEVVGGLVDVIVYLFPIYTVQA